MLTAPRPLPLRCHRRLGGETSPLGERLGPQPPRTAASLGVEPARARPNDARSAKRLTRAKRRTNSSPTGERQTK
eukprot:15466831-Alexandrium_andersonii.AAC.1